MRVNITDYETIKRISLIQEKLSMLQHKQQTIEDVIAFAVFYCNNELQTMTPT